ASVPLRELEKKVATDNDGAQWEFVNSLMEDFLNRNTFQGDWVISSHSLYWMGDNTEILRQLARAGRNVAIVIRDPGLLHEVETKYRPQMTEKKKRFISSNEIKRDLLKLDIPFLSESFAATMHVPKV